MKIKAEWIVKIQRASMRIFEAEDEDYPNRRVVNANRKAIDHYLSLITDNREEQLKILAAIERENFNASDPTYKPVFDNIRALGHEVIYECLDFI